MTKPLRQFWQTLDELPGAATDRRDWMARLGVVALPVDEITDPWLRQAIINEANRRWGRRNGGQGRGR